MARCVSSLKLRTVISSSLTSPSYNGVEKTSRPGATSLASEALRPTSSVAALHQKIPNRSLDGYDIPEETWPDSSNSTKPSRCRSFRKRFGRFFIHFARMPRVDHKYAHDYAYEALPPYSHRQASELAANTLSELPDQRLTTPEIPGQDLDVHELEDNSPYGMSVQTYSMENVESRDVPMCFEQTSNWGYLASGNFLQQNYTARTTPSYCPSLITEQSLSAVPGMTSMEHSHNSSPISLYTPTEASTGVNQQLRSSNMWSPHESISPVTSQLGPSRHPEWSTLTDAAARVSPLRSPGTSTPASGNFNNYQYAQSCSSSSTPPQGFIPYQHIPQDLFVSHHAPLASNVHTDRRASTQGLSNEESSFHRHQVYDQNFTEFNRREQLLQNISPMVAQNGNTSTGMFQQPFAQTEHGRHSPVRNQSPMEEPLDMVCETCGTKTTGV